MGRPLLGAAGGCRCYPTEPRSSTVLHPIIFSSFITEIQTTLFGKQNEAREEEAEGSNVRSNCRPQE